jgi:hypothetical protein
MKVLVGLILVLCLMAFGCADDETTIADGGADAVAEASVDAGPADVAPAEAAPEEAGPSEVGPASDTTPDQGEDQ